MRAPEPGGTQVNVISCPLINASARNNESGTSSPLPESTKESVLAL